MKLTLKILDGQGNTLAVESGDALVHLCYACAYQDGDSIQLESDSESVFLVVRLEDSIPPAFVYLSGGAYRLAVPFLENRISYSPKSFMGQCHLIEARAATPEEIGLYKNLAFNPFDCHENKTLFPHSAANVETRGEAVFAARNAIDGITANHGHGPWPFESWGINRREDAELRIDFGRRIRLDRVVVTLRADFPHDNWWEQATLRFSDGSRELLHFIKTDRPQEIVFSSRVVCWAVLCDLKKCQEDPSPFPALTQIELWGSEA